MSFLRLVAIFLVISSPKVKSFNKERKFILAVTPTIRLMLCYAPYFFFKKISILKNNEFTEKLE